MLKDAIGALTALKASFSAPNALKASFSGCAGNGPQAPGSARIVSTVHAPR
ncbi:hypothetical protein GCM10023192_05780 [Amycolatopsis samaneae]